MEDQFKCLIFISGFQSLHDADIRTWLVSELDQKKCIILKGISTEWQHLLNLKRDTKMVKDY